MIKVLRSGPPKTVICPTCYAALEYRLKDAKETEYSDWTGFTEVKKEIECPECKTQIQVK